jgi:hypothetical protein
MVSPCMKGDHFVHTKGKPHIKKHLSLESNWKCTKGLFVWHIKTNIINHTLQITHLVIKNMIYRPNLRYRGFYDTVFSRAISINITATVP